MICHTRLRSSSSGFFDTFGYLGFPGLIADRIDAVIEEFEALFARNGGGYGGRAHDGTSRSCLAPFIDQSAYLSSLLDDPRIHGILTSLLGDDFTYMGSDGNYYVGDTGWHSDGWHIGHRHIKIAFYLDPVSRDTGALRVIPGSHKPGDRYAEDLKKIHESEQAWGIHGNAVPAVSLDSTPGDVVCFVHNLKHAAFGGNNRRRMFTINSCERYPEERIQELRDVIAGGARFWVEEAYGPEMIRTASPERMRRLEQGMANDDHLPELSRKARETMAEPARG